MSSKTNARKMSVSSDQGSASVATKEKTTKHKLVDIGINLTHHALIKHWEAVIQRAIDAGVETMLLTGTSMKSSKKNLELAQTWSDKNEQNNLYCTVGVHPHDAKHFVSNAHKEKTDGASATTRSTIDEMREVLTSNQFAVAVGECGLDYNRNFSSKADQIRAFREQVKLAIELQYPLFVHEREAHEDLVSIFDQAEKEMLEEGDSNGGSNKKKLPPVVVHCFTGTLEEAQVYLSKGFYIGFTGTICKKERGEPLRQLLPHMPLDKIMLETDAPFMSFMKGKHGRHSEPAHVVGVAEMVAKCKDLTVEEVCSVTTQTALNFFGISSEEN